MTDKIDHFFDVYERIVPAWFWDAATAVGAVSFVSWIVFQIV